MSNHYLDLAFRPDFLLDLSNYLHKEKEIAKEGYDYCKIIFEIHIGGSLAAAGASTLDALAHAVIGIASIAGLFIPATICYFCAPEDEESYFRKFGNLLNLSQGLKHLVTAIGYLVMIPFSALATLFFGPSFCAPAADLEREAQALIVHQDIAREMQIETQENAPKENVYEKLNAALLIEHKSQHFSPNLFDNMTLVHHLKMLNLMQGKNNDIEMIGYIVGYYSHNHELMCNVLSAWVFEKKIAFPELIRYIDNIPLSLLLSKLTYLSFNCFSLKRDCYLRYSFDLSQDLLKNIINKAVNVENLVIVGDKITNIPDLTHLNSLRTLYINDVPCLTGKGLENLKTAKTILSLELFCDQFVDKDFEIFGQLELNNLSIGSLNKMKITPSFVSYLNKEKIELLHIVGCPNIKKRHISIMSQILENTEIRVD